MSGEVEGTVSELAVPAGLDLEATLAVAREVALEAGETLRRGFRKGPRARKKGVIDLVTEHDLASEALIRARLGAAFPSMGLLAEEGGGSAGTGLAWVCDPLDGTTNFAHGHPVFAVSLGLVSGGAPIAGVVHAPALGVTWWGGLGIGAFRDEGGERAPMRVTETDTLIESLVATGFPYDRATSDENNLREVSRVVLKVRGLRRCGAAAVDLALVADGTYDGYWEQKLSPWDVAAGIALVRAAGGRVTDYEGRPADAFSRRLVATNGALHAALFAEITAARA